VDAAFGPESSNEEVYDSVAKPLVPWVLAGGVATLLRISFLFLSFLSLSVQSVGTFGVAIFCYILSLSPYLSVLFVGVLGVFTLF
jgi:hypothetical protein